MIMKYTQIELQQGERRIIASAVSNMKNWREATDAEIKEVDDFHKWEEANPKLAEIGYEKYVQQLIGEKYSIQEELAISRQRDIKVDDFKNYFDFCEECKTKAKQLFPYK